MGYLNSRSKVRAHERRHQRIIRAKRRKGLFYLELMEGAKLPSWKRPRLLSSVRYEGELYDSGFTMVKRIKLPPGFEKLNGKHFLRAVGRALIMEHAMLADPAERCWHQYDCCGCAFAYTAKVLERNGREIVVQQDFGRNL